jgi:hypothetical protein
MKQYDHRPISNKDGIRVLTLLPALDFDSLLRGSLIEVSLSDPNAEYEALSYTWGSATSDRPLMCEGKELLITRNCELALRHLRQQRTTRTLWVDSICIDQSSTLDRNHQVGQMGLIYKTAICVLLWFGLADELTNSAFSYWRDLAEHLSVSASPGDCAKRPAPGL